MKRISIMSHIS